MRQRSWLRFFAVVFYCLAPSARCAATPPSAQLKIQVLEGDDAINNVRSGTAKEPVVRVQGEDGSPVSGATVTFQLPKIGAGASFPGDRDSLIVQTDENGQAVGRGLRPNSTAGQFQISVTASYQGQTTTVSFTQTNVIPAQPAQAAKKGGSSKILIIALAAVGGGVAAAVAGKGKGSSSPTQPTQPTQTVITIGSGSIGHP